MRALPLLPDVRNPAFFSDVTGGNTHLLSDSKPVTAELVENSTSSLVRIFYQVQHGFVFDMMVSSMMIYIGFPDVRASP